jgi:hypothetical protein
MILLGISGKRESGKSLLGTFLAKNHNWVKWSLADNLKHRAMQDFKLKPHQLWGTDKEVATSYTRTDGSPFTARDILIRMGTFYRSIDRLFWCKQFDARIGDKVVIDDIRFINEIRYFKSEYDGHFVRLHRSQEAIGKAALDDLSETELDNYRDWDFELTAERNNVPADLEKLAEYIDTELSMRNVR